MSKTATFIEISVFERTLPLVSGYLQAYASKDDEVRAAYAFRQVTAQVKTPLEKIAADALKEPSTVFAISCYLWNMALVERLIPLLEEANPNAWILLGGPEVMNHATQYLKPDNEKLILCNGEGERTFASFLSQLLQSDPDLSQVKGLSFYRDSQIVTTPAEDRIRDLSEIPSPFLTGLFKKRYRTAVLETNRGCPFKCSYCYWGAATNDKVVKFDEQRVNDEISWLAENGIALWHLADANWGMLKRDIEHSKHIAHCKEKTGLPVYLYFSSAKNSPDRVSVISDLFSQVGLINNQPISMQTLSETALEKVDRKNIKLSAYQNLQDNLNDKGINSFIELIWPLPGETLESFTNGIETLCDLKAATIAIYPHLLLHNTPMHARQKELGLGIRNVTDGVANADLVIQTAEVPFEDFVSGMRLNYSVNSLYNPRVLERSGQYLSNANQLSYGELLSGFAEFSLNDLSHPYTQYCEESIRANRFYEADHFPELYHLILHEQRSAFTQLMNEYMTQLGQKIDQNARLLFELDLVAMPYLYSNTPFAAPPVAFEMLEILDVDPIHKTMTFRVGEEFVELIQPHTNREAKTVMRLEHKREQLPYKAEQDKGSTAMYCYGMVTNISRIRPFWGVAGSVVSA